ncbi:MAG TPA: hypothetical protein VFA70_04600 [Dehalococcoidia bacterium]|nr:hypothetical protein [Dehalococcoidia bacterium]
MSIGGKWIGWVDFAASGSAVYETVFSSTTWAEFLAQHTRDGVELLYTLDALTLTGPQAVEPPATHVLASRMLWNWQFEIAVRQQLHARGIQVARSLVEAVAILGDADRVLEIARDMADINAGRVTAKELPKKIATDAQLAAASALPDPLGPEGGEECMRWLQALARRRFAHIAKAGG